MAEQTLSNRDQRNQETVPAKIEGITANSIVVGCLLAFLGEGSSLPYTST